MKRYANTKIEKNTDPDLRTLGLNYYAQVSYPEIPLNENDIYVLTDEGDRLDLLANQFYNDITLWWVISIANPDVIDFGSTSITPGTQLRIPVDLNSIISSFNSLNEK
tara:strand:- start:31 stop:354 length:324 start_codon:yes stop_codon:yes gene_type:complete